MLADVGKSGVEEATNFLLQLELNIQVEHSCREIERDHLAANIIFQPVVRCCLLEWLHRLIRWLTRGRNALVVSGLIPFRSLGEKFRGTRVIRPDEIIG